jgi:uncharacterized membrane protein YdjX (TVP38/TMEM64 family)
MGREEMEKQGKGRAGTVLKFVIVLLVIVGLLVLMRVLNVQQYLKTALDWIDTSDWIGILAFVLLYIAATVLFIPGSILTLGAGFIFGVFWGTVYVSVASTIGATAAFLVGRYLARDWISGKVEGNQRFRAIDDAVGKEGWKIVLLTRLSPVFPFNMLNYAYGLTKVKLRAYFFASWIGMIPGTIMYVYIGSLAGDLATLGTGARSRTPMEWALYGLGLAATIAVTVYVTMVAKRAITKIGISESKTQAQDESGASQ